MFWSNTSKRLHEMAFQSLSISTFSGGAHPRTSLEAHALSIRIGVTHPVHEKKVHENGPPISEFKWEPWFHGPLGYLLQRLHVYTDDNFNLTLLLLKDSVLIVLLILILRLGLEINFLSDSWGKQWQKLRGEAFSLWSIDKVSAIHAEDALGRGVYENRGVWSENKTRWLNVLKLN